MDIKASVVKKLRDTTGAGMMDCKKALVKAEGDFDAATKILQEMGLAAVAKRADRATDNGGVFTKVTKDKAILVEISCETDFVAKNEDFKKLGNDMCSVIAEKGYSEINDELNEMVTNLIATIKENMSLKTVLVIDLSETEYATTYIHGAGEKGVLVEFKADSAAAFENDAVKEFCYDCALHVAAYTPSYLNSDAIDADKLAELEEIFTKQALGMGKPEKIVPNIVKGMIAKHFKEICFLDQAFIKEDKLSVSQKMKEVAKAANCKLEITGFQMYTAGA